jgi:PAS domain S-box-containing protein
MSIAARCAHEVGMARRGLPYYERLRRLRQNPRVGYPIACGCVAVSTLVQWSLHDLLAVESFGAFYLAVIVSTLVGGAGPGTLATLLCGIAEAYFFLPPPFSFALASGGTPSLILFFFVAALDVVLISVMNRAVDALWTQRENVRRAVESAPIGVVAVNAEGMITLVNAATQALFGYSRDELLGRRVELLVPDGLRAKHVSLRSEFAKQPETRAMGAGRDLCGRRKDGSEFPVEIALNPIEREGRRGVLATIVDVTQRKRAEERQNLLTRDLHHRTQNLFAVIQAVTNRSLAGDAAMDEARQQLLRRLQALSRTYLAVTDAAGEGVALGKIVNRELAGFEGRFEVQGDDTVLPPSAAQNFSLIVHELVTNASKHGALSVPEGKISIRWGVTKSDGNSVMTFLWRERDGPSVSNPTRKGFGHVILSDVAQRFASKVVMEFPASGFCYELQTELEKLDALE